MNELHIPMTITDDNSVFMSVSGDENIGMETDLVVQGTGTTNYEQLYNKPQINGETLIGNKSLEDLGIVNNMQPDWAQNDTEQGDYIKNKPANLVQDANYTHTDNNYTTAEKEKLGGIASGAEPNVQSDWSQGDNSKDDFIKNKPENLVQDASYVHTDNNYTATEKNKLSGIAEGAEVNVQADWNQTSSGADDYIKNKPSNLVQDANYVHTDNNYSDAEKAKVANIPSKVIDLSDVAVSSITDGQILKWDATANKFVNANESGGGGAVTSVNGQTGDVVLGAEDVGALPNDTPLFSGDYNDLTNKPTIPNALADLSDDSTHRLVTDTEKSGWDAKSDFSGSYNDLTDKPSIPSALADLSDDSAHRVVTDSEKSTWNGKSDFSGSYTDLTNKPTLGTASALDVASSGDASNSQVVKGDDSRLTDARTPVSHTHTTSDITDFPDMTDYIQKSSTSGFVKNDGSIDTTSYQPTESGKGLSSNDYTTAEKTKLSGISTNAKKVESSTTNGNIKIDNVETQVYDGSGKADKVTGATAGDLAGLDSNGNLTDSGWASDKTTTNASGNPISIANLKSDQLAIDPIITFEPIQAGSGTPSPSNIRAISGYDKVDVQSCGKNLIESKLSGYGMNSAGNIVLSADNELYLAKVQKGTTYTISNNGSEQNPNFSFFYTKPIGAQVSYDGTRYGPASQFTAPIDGYVAIRTLINTSKEQLEKGTTVSAYEPYHSATTISESLGQTVYWGELDLRSGKFKVIGQIIDMGDLNWNYVTQYDYPVFVGGTFPNDNIDFTSTGKILYCSCYNVLNGMPYASFRTNPHSYEIANITNQTAGNRVNVQDPRCTDANDFINAVTGQKLVYKLATPFYIQLTPHELTLLKTYAYVSTNGSDISLAYHNGEMASLGDVGQLAESMENGFAFFDTKIAKKRTLGISGNVPTAEELAAIDYESGSQIIDFYNASYSATEIHASLIFTRSAVGYGVGILLSYYSNGVISFVRQSNGAVGIYPITHS